MTDRIIVLELSRIEAAHLAGLVGQFADLLADGQASADPAIGRLVPDAYPDDEDAAREFREVTERELLERRGDDAGTVLRTLAPVLPEGADAALDDVADRDVLAQDVVEIPLAADDLQAWLRCLAALRLVLAVRLGIRDETDGSQDDPRFGIYEWLGYRLDGLVQAASPDE
ncbi:DUF2017 family protein [Microbacterium pygmaeum]|uniref:Uncharacterized protein n=1 Tax=Microbacterium pygmaeum TaxID=370764 RepID=A0A1G8ABG9_9MICO|nr:DUF2017 family protein [Microbacterium pygmaeum]SDH18288.1 protein of unknown function [Microbacterium pygmaeum]